MTPPFFDSFLKWVHTHHPELGPVGPDIGLSDVMVSPHVVPIRRKIVNQLTSGCQAIFDATRTSPTSTPSVFTSFDFYITPDGPRLIEVNTNAAGALLVQLLSEFHGVSNADYFSSIRGMFASISARPIRRIAIVDETPDLQKTRFEFVMFQSLFQSWGWDAIIIDPANLQWTGTSLVPPDGVPIDVVYNRFCDFYLETDRGSALKSALTAGLPVTPNPDEYERIADKLKLVKLAQHPNPEIQALIPPVMHVNQSDHDNIWARRKSLFFKPARSFGSKAAYKGERISKKVFESFWEGDTIAQPYFPAGTITRDGIEYKYDIRVYTFEGKFQLMGARLFQGQLTNFQTPGGGFAPITIMD